MSVSPSQKQDQAVVNAVSGKRLVASTRAIARWVRLSGTPDEAKAFDWIEGELRRIGYDVTRYLHPALVSWPESASLMLTSRRRPHGRAAVRHPRVRRVHRDRRS